jgi:superfamily II DNA or RNA helicase
VTTRNEILSDIVVSGRTKSRGVVTLRSLPGWVADVRDQGHRRGFVVRIQARESLLAARIERTPPDTHWADARDFAARLLVAVANGRPTPDGFLHGANTDSTQEARSRRTRNQRKRKGRTSAQADGLQDSLPTFNWPAPDLFPHNANGATVAGVLVPDLLGSSAPLIITGYSSLDKLIPLLAQLGEQNPTLRGVRLLLGTEPRADKHALFPLGHAAAQEIADYWRTRGISMELCGQVLLAVDLLEQGLVQARTSDAQQHFVHGKLYVTEHAVTLGSSNFSHGGLSGQHETNVRFTPEHQLFFEGARQLGERLWEIGADYTQGLLDLLRTLLKSVTWQEALARACAEVLEGSWASKYVGKPSVDAPPLWPSQREGIAQALWVLENGGGVLVSDATGSGKTRMGAYLIAAIMQRFVLGKGRARIDLRPLLICPPSVVDRWERANEETGFPLHVFSDGVLSSGGKDALERLLDKTRGAQVLALDEAHRFLNQSAERTRLLHRNNLADYVLLFTATPVSRGPRDLVGIVNLLGADNFDDSLLATLNRLLAHRLGDEEDGLDPEERDAFRRAIQRFTVRHTKAMLNALIDAQPEAFRDERGQMCRYPKHDARIYPCNEKDQDVALARAIQERARQLRGIANLRGDVVLTDRLQRYLQHVGRSPDDYLRMRLALAMGGAAHRVLAALRSSKAAVYEHLHGTHAATFCFALGKIKNEPTGNVLGTLADLRTGQPPRVLFGAEVPEWLATTDAYRRACDEEIAIYEDIDRLLASVSDGREQSKASVLSSLLDQHRIVLGFDSHLITLHDLERRLNRVADAQGYEVAIATGEDRIGRKRVQDWARLGSDQRGKIALCSDVMSEGFNLQGASAVVHLDMPTVVRQAEQRVGRVDRLDSPFASIEAWWPGDAPEFALTTDEKFLARHRFVTDLLGSNMDVPAVHSVATEQLIQEFERETGKAQPWDHLVDAFEPVRGLVRGPDSLVPKTTYDEMRTSTARVIASVSVVDADEPRAFFAFKGTQWGAPRWVYFDGPRVAPIIDLEAITTHLRRRLTGRDRRELDACAEEALRNFLTELAQTERQLLPRKKQVALAEMREVLRAYERDGSANLDADRLAVVQVALRLLEPPPVAKWSNLNQIWEDHAEIDLGALADHWLVLIHPVWQAHLKSGRGPKLLRLRDIRAALKREPLPTEDLLALVSEARWVRPADERVVSAIIGVVDAPA